MTTTRTRKHAEKLADRRLTYADRKQSDRIARRADEIMAADSTVKLADARQQAIKEAIAASIERERNLGR